MKDTFSFSNEDLKIIENYKNDNLIFKFDLSCYKEKKLSFGVISTDEDFFLKLGEDFNQNILYLSANNRGIYTYLDNILTKINIDFESYIYFLKEFDKIVVLYQKTSINELNQFYILFDNFVKFKLNITKIDEEHCDNFYWKQFIMFNLETDIDTGIKIFFSNNKIPITILNYLFVNKLDKLGKKKLDFIYKKYFIDNFIDIFTSIQNITNDFLEKKVYTEEEKKRIREIWGSLPPPFPLD